MVGFQIKFLSTRLGIPFRDRSQAISDDMVALGLPAIQEIVPDSFETLLQIADISAAEEGEGREGEGGITDDSKSQKGFFGLAS